MDTLTKQDKFLFFGITFAALVAFIFNINYVNPIMGFGIGHIFLLATLTAGVITALKFNFDKISEKYRSTNPNLFSGIIWSFLATIMWVQYYQKHNFNWIIASLFTFIAVINWVGYFRKFDK